MVQPYVPGGGGTAASIAEQRYAALRLQQAVRAGLVPASVLNAHPNAYPAIWRMVSQKVAPAATAQGVANPVAWLRQGGGPRVGGQGGVPGPFTAPAPPVVASQGVPGDLSWIHPQMIPAAGNPPVPGMVQGMAPSLVQQAVMNNAVQDPLNRFRMAMTGAQPGVYGPMSQDPRIAALLQALAAQFSGGGGFVGPQTN